MFLVVLTGLAAAFINSVNSIANKYLVGPNALGALTAGLLIQAVAAAFAIPTLAVAHAPLALAAVPHLVVVTIVSLVGFVLISYAFAQEDASAVAPILGLKVVFVAVMESIAQGHSLAPGVWVGAAVSVAAIALISQRDQWSLHPRDLLRPGMVMMCGAALCFATCDIFVRGALALWPASGKQWFSAYSVALTGLVAAVLLFIPALRGQEMGARTWRLRWPLLIGGATILLTQFFLFISFALGGQVTFSNILYNTRSLMVVGMMALIVLVGRSTVERAGWRAYAFRTTGAVLTVCAVLLAALRHH